MLYSSNSHRIQSLSQQIRARSASCVVDGTQLIHEVHHYRIILATETKNCSFAGGYATTALSSMSQWHLKPSRRESSAVWIEGGDGYVHVFSDFLGPDLNRSITSVGATVSLLFFFCYRDVRFFPKPTFAIRVNVDSKQRFLIYICSVRLKCLFLFFYTIDSGLYVRVNICFEIRTAFFGSTWSIDLKFYGFNRSVFDLFEKKTL